MHVNTVKITTEIIMYANSAYNRLINLPLNRCINVCQLW